MARELYVNETGQRSAILAFAPGVLRGAMRPAGITCAHRFTRRDDMLDPAFGCAPRLTCRMNGAQQRPP